MHVRRCVDGNETIQEDARGEAAALRLWNGRGAARLLRSTPDDYTLLLERCIPGHDLWSLSIHGRRSGLGNFGRTRSAACCTAT